MTTLNNEPFLTEAIESILQQSYERFEFIIVDDGSTDGTSRILASYSDPRITVLTNAQTNGIPSAAQRALERARGEYIARMDSDDIATPQRLQLEVDFLDRHPSVGIVGGQRLLLDSDRRLHPWSRLAPDHNGIAWRVFLGGPFVHPTTMVRRHLLEQVGGYDPRYWYASDLELYTRLIFVCQFANLEEVLVHYRIHDHNTSSLWRKYPAPPPPRSLLASKLLGQKVDAAQFNLITSVLYAGARVSTPVAHELCAFMLQLFVACQQNDLFVGDLSAITHQVSHQIETIARQVPESNAARIRSIVWGSRDRARRGLAQRRQSRALRRFVIERNSGQKPLL